MNKPNPEIITTPQVKQNSSQDYLISELEKYKSLAKEYQEKNEKLEAKVIEYFSDLLF